MDAFNNLLSQLEEAVQGERRFIADAAHELRTPLAALSAQAQVTLHATNESERSLALQSLTEGAHRCARLSEQLLDLARLEANQSTPARESVNMAKLIDVVAHDFEIPAQKKKIELSIQTDSIFLHANVDEIGILLRNLIDNAVRYTPQNGRIEVLCQKQNESIILKVADNGPGVLPAEREKIFERFYRVAGNGQRGSGIGLSMVAQIASSMKARIEAREGLEGRGFGISLHFPN